MSKLTAKKIVLAALRVAGLFAFLGNTSAPFAQTITTLTYPDGSQYIGEVTGNVPNGQGTTTWPDGKRFTGEFRDGKSNGQGTIILPDGRRYVGEFSNGKPEGQGTSYWPNGQLRFSGMWHNGQFTSKQIASTTPSRSAEPSSGDPTRTQNTPSTPTNQGTLKLSNGRTYVGELRDRKPNGIGTMTYPDGQKYIGQFVDGLRHGQATVNFVDGRKFAGEYRDDKRNGPGTLVLPNGEKYVGEYRDGEKNGQGTSYLANGEVQFSGLWANGNFAGGSAVEVEQPRSTEGTLIAFPEVQTPVKPSVGLANDAGGPSIFGSWRLKNEENGCRENFTTFTADSWGWYVFNSGMVQGHMPPSYGTHKVSYALRDGVIFATFSNMLRAFRVFPDGTMTEYKLIEKDGREYDPINKDEPVPDPLTVSLGNEAAGGYVRCGTESTKILSEIGAITASIKPVNRKFVGGSQNTPSHAPSETPVKKEDQKAATLAAYQQEVPEALKKIGVADILMSRIYGRANSCLSGFGWRELDNTVRHFLDQGHADDAATYAELAAHQLDMAVTSCESNAHMACRTAHSPSPIATDCKAVFGESEPLR